MAPTHVGDIEYLDAGEGPTLVFLHLFLAGADHWDLVIPHLSDGYRCIAPTLPLGAHRIPADRDADLSPSGLAKAVVDVLDHLDLAEATLVGSDTGGAIAQIITAANPDRVRHLVLTNCDMYDEFPPKIIARFRPLTAIPGCVFVLSWLLRIPLSWRLPMTYGSLALTRRDHVIDGWTARFRASGGVRRDARKAFRAMNPAFTNAAATALAADSVPVSVFWGDEDTVFTRANAERFASSIATATVEFVPKSGAFVCWDQPLLLARLIDAAKVEASAG